MTISRHTHFLDVAGVQLHPLDLSFSLDEERVPYAQLTATCALGSGAETLDPTLGQRVNVRLRQDFGTSRTIAEISADYAGQTIGALGYGSEPLNENTSMEIATGGVPDGWISLVTLEQSTERFHTGAHSVLLTDLTDNTPDLSTDGFFPYQAGSPFAVDAWVYFDETVAGGNPEAHMEIYFFDEAGTIISNQAIDSLIDFPVNQWVHFGGAVEPGHWVTVPVVKAAVAINFFAPVANGRMFVDDVAVRYGRTSIRSLSSGYGTPFNSFGVRESTTVRGDLGLRLVSIDHEAATVTIEASSDEARLQDYALVDTGPLTPGTSTVLGCVNMVLSRVLNDAVSTVGTGSQAVEADALPWNPGETGWSYLQSIVGMAGLRLWCDELGLWHLEDPETYIPPGQVTLSLLNLGTMAEISDRSSEWADSAVVAYRWTDSGGVARVRYDVSNPGGTKAASVEIDRPYPGAGLARAIARKLRQRRRVLEVGGVSDYSVRPYRAAQVTLPNDLTQSGIVSSVQWTLPADRMDVGTRDIISIGPNAWLYTPSGVSWNDIDAGVSWEEYQWMG